jgi:hypothetical protein
MFAIVQPDVWITADFKETQLRRMHHGQLVTIHVDAFGRDFNGYVEAMPGASGDRFSLLSPYKSSSPRIRFINSFEGNSSSSTFRMVSTSATGSFPADNRPNWTMTEA